MLPMPARLKPYAKFVVGVATLVLTAAQTQISMSPAAHGWVSVALTALGAAGVYAVPNRPAVPLAVRRLRDLAAKRTARPYPPSPDHAGGGKP